MNKNRLAGRFAAGLALLMLSSACQSAPNPTPLPSDVPSQSKESVSTPEPTLTEPEIPTFFFSNFELDVKKESQAQLISFFDLAEGCTLDNPKEVREPDAALSSLIQQLVEAINTRNTDLYNSLFAQEEARLDRLPVMPEIQEYTIHPQADFTLVDLTWLDCDQTLHSQYWLTLDKTHDLKIDRLREIPDCADRSTVSMGDAAQLSEEFVTALRSSDYFAVLAFFPRTAPCYPQNAEIWNAVTMESAEVQELTSAGTWTAALITLQIEDPGCTGLIEGNHTYCLVMENIGGSIAIEGFYWIPEAASA
ncbi:hypothetical protein [Holdemania massiliensis]|uniref:hypothetical protein n=1 Tax=Holdemania massiliensis TaxID=1468449 RepID=UPI00351F919B